MKIILIGNYAKDKQMSMELFANLLRNGYINAGNQAVIWRPPVVFGRLSSNTLNGFGKWLAYIDKWLIFPILILLKRCFPANRKFNVRFHICDHSNVI
ncbi:MAG: glycosyltransferase family 1 protein, partial [Bacteroidetes bacterium]|nr:glycosyltransferase family 1 protein [Bacteroidota bacterium]